jgi:hypothetical protein
MIALLLSPIGRWLAGAAVAALVAGGGWAWVSHHYEAKGEAKILRQWDQAKIAEAKREADLKAKADAAELMLNAATSSLDDTADQLNKAREDAQAKAPPVPDCVDDAASLGELRRIIDGK